MTIDMSQINDIFDFTKLMKPSSKFKFISCHSNLIFKKEFHIKISSIEDDMFNFQKKMLHFEIIYDEIGRSIKYYSKNIDKYKNELKNSEPSDIFREENEKLIILYTKKLKLYRDMYYVFKDFNKYNEFEKLYYLLKLNIIKFI